MNLKLKPCLALPSTLSTLILDGTMKTLEITLQELNDFKHLSGLKVNYTKSQVIWIGSKGLCEEKLMNNTD